MSLTGGVAIYVKKPIKYEILKCRSIELMFWYLTIEIFDCDMKGIYSGSYRSPDSNDIESTNIFSEYIESNINANKLNIFMGDINFDFAKNIQRILVMKNMFDSFGIDIVSGFFTRITNESQTQIDLILSNRPAQLFCQTEEADRISDHETISIAFKKEIKINATNDTFLSWNQYNSEQLLENLRKSNWLGFDNLNVDEKVELIRQNLIKSVEPMVKTIPIKEKEVKLSWFDNELKCMKNHKIEYYSLWKLDRNDLNWLGYDDVRNKYNKLIKQKKNDAIKNEILAAGSDQKKMWRSLNKISPSKKSKIPDEIVFNGVEYNDEHIICDKFNCFFIDSINDINMQIPQTEPAQLNERNGNTFKFVEVTLDQVIAAAKYMTKKVNKSQICNSMVWFDSMDYTSYFLTETINYSFEQGYFPSQWKTSTITPIPKITGTNISSNFSPINVLPVDEKICECLVGWRSLQ